MNRIVFIIFCLIAISCYGQTKERLTCTHQGVILPDSVERLDYNGDRLALVQVKSDIENLSFSGMHIFKDIPIIKKGDISFVYMVSGARSLTIVSDKYLPLDFRFEKPLKGGSLYELNIEIADATGSVSAKAPDERFVLLIDGIEYPKGVFNMPLVVGLHDITLKDIASGRNVHTSQFDIREGQVTDLGIITPKIRPGQLVVNVENDALVLIDNNELEEKRLANNNIYSVPVGNHDVISIIPIDVFNGNREYRDTIGTFERVNVKDETEVDMRLLGSIKFETPGGHTYHKLSKTISVDGKGKYTKKNGTVIPKRYAIAENEAFDLRGDYIVNLKAQGYNDKKVKVTVLPGDPTVLMMKLDKSTPYKFLMYDFNINSYLGLDLAVCGKYFGWFGRVGFLGGKDPKKPVEGKDYDKLDLSYSGATGPMFTILRSRVWLYLQLGGGYRKKYYNDEQKQNFKPSRSWLVEGALVARFQRDITKNCFTIKIGYDYPFAKDSKYRTSIQNLIIGLGIAF